MILSSIGFPDSSVGKKYSCSARDPSSIPGLGRSTGEGRDRLPTPVFLGFPGGSGKESACNAAGLGLIPRLGRSPGRDEGQINKLALIKNKDADSVPP